MLTVGDWAINAEKGLLHNDKCNENKTLSEQALSVLIYLCQHQHSLISAQSLHQTCWPQHSKFALAEIITIIDELQQKLGENALIITAQHSVLLTLPTYKYNIEEVSFADMKAKMLQQEQKTFAARKQQAQQKAQQQQAHTSSLQPAPWSLSQKILGVTVIAILIAGFLAASV